MMYLFLPLRKTVKVIFTRYVYTKRERIPLTLRDCLVTAPTPRCRLWKYWLILFFTVPTCYYIFSNRSSATVQKHTVEMSEDDFHYNTEKISIEKEFLVTDGTKKIAVKKHTLKVNHSRASTTTTDRNPNNLPICEIISNGNNAVTLRETTDEWLSNEFPLVKMGGYHRPRHCHSRHKVGILVPFRDRKQHLAVFLFNIHPFLMRQKLEYRIFVIEQTGKEEFNKGRLFNAGFKEMTKLGKWKCVIFHDVDLLPLDNRIMYTCPIYPRHMCASVIEKESIPGYRALFGGVTSMTLEQYKKVNGYSNLYWGWGGEDNDMFWRYRLLNDAVDRYKTDGLSSVNYSVVSIGLRHLYTHIKLDINPQRKNITKLG